MTAAPEEDSIVDKLLRGEPARAAAQLAYWLNLSRVDQGLSRTPEATRSTMIWALMTIDSAVESAFAGAGVSLVDWIQTLGLKSDPESLRLGLEKTYGGEVTPRLHRDLIDAFDRHLESRRRDRDTPTASELALAILDSIETGRSKELPRRLEQLGFDRRRAIVALEAEDTTRSVDLNDFSGSVRMVIDRIGLQTEVTPGRLAAELAELHPTYANGLLGSADFSGDEAVPYPLADILVTVRHQAGELEPGQVIDTRNVLIHLADFDHHVRTALEVLGAYRELLVEAGRLPGGDTPLATAPTGPGVDRPPLDMLADVPIDNPEFDVMNFGPYVEAVVQLIENPRTTTPLSIAVNGPWGSGKTSLGRMVETRLEREQKDRLPPIITWFNAWLHDSAEDLGAALTAHIGRTLYPHRHPLRRIIQLLPKNMLTAGQRHRRRLWVTGLGLLIALTVAYGSVRLTTDGIVDEADDTASIDNGDGSVAEAAAGGGAGIALLVAIIAAASRFFDPARSAAAFIASPREEAQEGALDDARKDIEKLLHRAGIPTSRNMVIFVDDLERSRPPSAIDICEAANQLLNHPGVFIVYLADMAKIASTVEIKYRDYAQWAGPGHRSSNSNGADDPAANGSATTVATAHNGNGWWGRAYMEKMVQIQIDIPELDRAAGSDLLGRITAQSRTAADRRLEEDRQRQQFSWAAAIAWPVRIIADWVQDQRKRSLVERLNRLVDETTESGTLDIEAFEAAAERTGIDPATRGRVIRRHTEESATYRAAEDIAVEYLPNNPRAIKRLANRLRFEAEVSDELGLIHGPKYWVDPRLVGKWAVLTTRWPSLTESLQSGRLDWRELELLPAEDLAVQLRNHVRPDVAHHEIDEVTALLSAEPVFGDSIELFLYHRLAPVEGAADGSAVPVS